MVLAKRVERVVKDRRVAALGHAVGELLNRSGLLIGDADETAGGGELERLCHRVSPLSLERLGEQTEQLADLADPRKPVLRGRRPGLPDFDRHATAGRQKRALV